MTRLALLVLFALSMQCKKSTSSESNKNLQKIPDANATNCFIPKNELNLASNLAPHSLVIKDVTISDQFPYMLSINSDSPYDIAKISYCSESGACKSGYTVSNSFDFYPEMKSTYTIKIKICFDNDCSPETERKFTNNIAVSEKTKESFKEIEKLREEVLLASEKRVIYEGLDRSYGATFLKIFPYAVSHPDRLLLAQDLCNASSNETHTVFQTHTIVETVDAHLSKMDATITPESGSKNKDDPASAQSEIAKDLKKIGQYFGATITFFATALLGRKIYDIRQAKAELVRGINMQKRIDEFVNNIKSNAEFHSEDYRPAISQLTEIRAAYPDLFTVEYQRLLDEFKTAELDFDLKSKRLATLNSGRSADGAIRSDILAKMNDKNIHLKATVERFAENKQAISSKYSTTDVALGVGKYVAIIAAAGSYTISGFFLADTKIQSEMYKVDWDIYNKLVQIEALRTHLPI